MKKVLLILLSSLSLLANNVMLYDFGGNVGVSEVVDNKLNDKVCVPGITFSLTNGLSIKTETNGVVSYMVPHRIAFTQSEGSAVYFNGDVVTYVESNVPHVVKVKDASFNFSLLGQLYVVSESDKTSIIGTGVGNIAYDKAKLFIKAGEKYTHVYVVEGKAIVYDNKSKKKKDLKEGDYLVITPHVTLSPRESTVSTFGNSFSVKEVEDEEKQVHVKEIENLQRKLKDTIFINYGSNIFGVKLGLP
jgi:uncharacterized RmlC-like cupin family protein